MQRSGYGIGGLKAGEGSEVTSRGGLDVKSEEGEAGATSPVGKSSPSAATVQAQYVSANCVVYSYYSGDISSIVDEHFSKALGSTGTCSTSGDKETGGNAKGTLTVPNSAILAMKPAIL